MKKVIFVVGHENWGKSKTLKALTDDNYRIKNYKIDNTSWFIRRMSNDDQPNDYYNFMKNLDPKIKPNVIATFCPNFDKDRYDITVKILHDLKNKHYELYFWVLEYQFSTKKKMSSSYIDELRNFGTVEVYSKFEQSNIRAVSLRTFIREHA